MLRTSARPSAIFSFDANVACGKRAVSNQVGLTTSASLSGGSPSARLRAKLASLEKAKLLQDRGYIVLPDPTQDFVIQAFKRGAFKEFERHSRVGMVSEEGFAKRVRDVHPARDRQARRLEGAQPLHGRAHAVVAARGAQLGILGRGERPFLLG